MSVARRSVALIFGFVLVSCDAGGRGTGILPNKPQTVFVSFANAGTLKHTVTVEHPNNGVDEEPVMTITSIVENVGSLGQQITIRTCQPTVDDLAADGVTFIGLDPVCEDNEASLELKSGEKTPQIMGRFQLVAGPGVYKILVRQLLKPNSGTEIETRIP